MTSTTSYLMIIWAATRAVDLELVKGVPTQEFLLAFRRFMFRRGLYFVVYSDNEKSFKRAEIKINIEVD